MDRQFTRAIASLKYGLNEKSIMALSPALKKKYGEHIGQDVMYPATCNDLITACNGMSEFSKQEKVWFAENLPHGTFNNANEVKRAVGV